jgi:hypothetical protein
MATENAASAAEIDDIVGISEALAGLEPVKTEPNDKLIDNDETESSESEDPNEDDAEEKDEEKSDPDSEEKEDDEESEDEDETPGQEKVQKRIDKLTAKRKEAEEKAAALSTDYEQAKTRLAELEAQVNESARPVLQPTAENPLADVDTDDALDAKIKSAQEVRRWALRNTDGATVKRPDGTEVYVDSDEVKNYLIKADDVLTVHAPARKQWLAQRAPAVEAAKNVFPDIFKKGSPMNQAFQATVKQAPELLKLPQAEYWVGLALYGEQQLMSRQQADAAKAKAADKISSKKPEAKSVPTPAGPVSSQKSATKDKGGKQAAARLFERGDRDALENFAMSLLS